MVLSWGTADLVFNSALPLPCICRLKGNIRTTLLICALILNAVKNIRKEILNAINPGSRWTREIQVTQGKDQLRKRRKVTKAQRKSM